MNKYCMNLVKYESLVRSKNLCINSLKLYIFFYLFILRVFYWICPGIRPCTQMIVKLKMYTNVSKNRRL